MFKKLWEIGGENPYRLRMRTRGCRGMFATVDIPAGVRILEIPERHLMTIESVYETDPQIRSVYPRKTQTNDRLIYHLYLLLTGAVQPTPSEKIYLQSLPKDVSNFCLFYDESVLRPLKGTCFARKNGREEDLFHSIDNYRLHYQHIMDRLDIPKASRDEYLRSTAMVNSRVFQFQDGRKDRMALVPIADLINHGSDRDVNTTWYFDKDKRVFVVETTKPILAGKQVYDSYGAKTDIQLLYTYGFYMPENEHGNILIPRPHGEGDLIISRHDDCPSTTMNKRAVRSYTRRLSKILASLPPDHPLRPLLQDQYTVLVQA